MSEQPELKRLAPVVSAASVAATRLQGLHGRALALVPQALKPTVEHREEQLVSLATPYLTALSNRAPAVLQAVDARVGLLSMRGASLHVIKNVAQAGTVWRSSNTHWASDEVTRLAPDL